MLKRVQSHLLVRKALKAPQSGNFINHPTPLHNTIRFPKSHFKLKAIMRVKHSYASPNTDRLLTPKGITYSKPNSTTNCSTTKATTSSCSLDPKKVWQLKNPTLKSPTIKEQA